MAIAGKSGSGENRSSFLSGFVFVRMKVGLLFFYYIRRGFTPYFMETLRFPFYGFTKQDPANTKFYK